MKYNYYVKNTEKFFEKLRNEGCNAWSYIETENGFRIPDFPVKSVCTRTEISITKATDSEVKIDIRYKGMLWCIIFLTVLILVLAVFPGMPLYFRAIALLIIAAIWLLYFTIYRCIIVMLDKRFKVLIESCD